MMSVLIATPCYGGQLYASCASSIMDTRLLLQSKGINHEWLPIMGDSLIPRARNACIAYFLCSEHTHILFVDGDIMFDPQSLSKLLARDIPVVSCAYPKKNLDLPSLVAKSIEAGKAGREVHPGGMILTSMSYVVETEKDTKLENGWLKADMVGTGFLLLKREVVEKLVSLHPELKYENDCHQYDDLHPSINTNFYALFDTRIVDSRYVSEDYSFCMYLREAGYDIWVDTTSGLVHIGPYSFSGNLYLSLLARTL